ncbi:breast cancer type 1 susceptibility protein-like [Cylas formicarius]|uniref:breast cancer type 1 susceptibility protein-like n=1 Tax=Cylas formicarius TaxID=197179 RepID=UPI002958BF97|nr:breast cancer type 1 susceptibility protein-like [Cylas formicarius]
MDKQSLLKISSTIAVLKEKIKCTICLDLVQDSMQLDCNHRFCKNCITEHRSHKYSSCPLCKKPLKRRINYKDQFADELSKFVNQVYGLINDKYGSKVETIFKGNMQHAANTSNEINNVSGDGSSKIQAQKELDITKPTTDAFSILKDKPIRCYGNNRQQRKKQELQKYVLEFQNSETRNRIIDWLNCTQQKYDIINKTENAKARLVEISTENVSNRIRSQSLNLGDNNFSAKLVNRYHSLNEGLHETDNYQIEEIESEKLLRQVERKVVQNMLEEDCLENLEKLAKESVLSHKKTTKKRKKKSPSCRSSGWDRIKVVNRTINKACKIPKKLNISLQSSQINENRKVADKESSKLKKNVLKEEIQKENKENENNQKVAGGSHQEHESNIVNPTYSLSVVEKYFLQNINTIDIDKDTSSESCTDLCKNQFPVGKKDVKLLRDNRNKETELEKSVADEDIFSLPTQKTLHSPKHRDMFCVFPVTTNFAKTEEIVSTLSNILENCVSESKSIHGDMSVCLTKCFSNIKSYVDKIKTLRVNTDNKETQTHQNFCTTKTQTDNLSLRSQEVQTSFQGIITQTSEEHNIPQEGNKTELDSNSNDVCIQQLNTKENVENSAGSVLVCSIPTGLEDKIKRKLTFSDITQRFKRIRKPSCNSDSDDDGTLHKKECNRFIRDDLTVQFVETETEGNNIEKASENSQGSEDILNDNYLEEIMRKYGDSPPKQVVKQSKNEETTKFESASVADVRGEEKYNSQKGIHNKTPKSQKSDVSGQIFTANDTFQKNQTKFDKEKEKAEKLRNEFSSENDIVEDTPVLEPKNKKPKLQLSKNTDIKVSLLQRPLEIKSKTSPKCGNGDTGLKLNNSVVYSTEREVAEMLENLENDEFFEDMDYETQNKTAQKYNPAVNEQPKTNCENSGFRELATIQNDNVETIENYFDGDDQVEAELERICISAEQRKVEEMENVSKVKILQNIRIRHEVVSANDIISDSNSDLSDEEVVETTPDNLKLSSTPNRFFNGLENVSNLSPTKNNLDDLCLPPPPGFGDEPKLESPVEIDNEILNKSQLTPDRLTDFIVTPQTYWSRREEKSLKCSQLSNISLVIATNTPKLHTKIQHSTPTSQAKYIETLNFSPINKVTTQNFQGTCLGISRKTPLVTSSKSATKTQNLMTSTPNQRSILNYVKSSQENANSAKTKPCIIWTRIVNKDLQVFKELEVKKLVTVSNSFGPSTTHLVVVVDENGRLKSHTAKFLLAVAAGLWVVRYEWAQDCLKYNRIVSEEPYEALDLSGVPGPKISRTTRLINPLFKGFRFCCAPPFSIVSRTEIENALKMLGAQIVNHPRDLQKNDDHIVIILTDTTATEEINQFESFLEDYKTVTVDIEWLTKCIGQYKIVSFRPYLLCSDELICDLGYPSVLIESVPFTLTEATLGN